MRASRSVAVLAVLVASSLVAVACGDGGGASGGVVPKQAALVLLADIERGESGELGETREVLARVPAWQLANERLPGAQQVVDQLLVTVGGKPNLDWEEEVEPWLGSEAGAAGWIVDGGGDEVDARLVVWLETNDEEASEQAMRDSLGERDAGSFEGAELRRGTGQLEDVYWTVEDGRVLVGNSKGSVTAALRAGEGEALEDTEEWDRLRGERGDDALLSIYGTERVSEQFEQLMESIEANDEESAEQLRQSVEQLRGTAREFGYHLGADDEGLWFDMVAVGEQPVGDVPEDVPSAREMVERLPESSVVAAASRGGNALDEDAAESLRTSLGQYEAMLAQAPPVVRDLPVLFEQLLSEEATAQAADAYRGDVSTAVTVGEDDELSIVGSYGIEDEDAAVAYDALVWKTLGDYLAKRSTVRVKRVPSVDGATVTISGIPANRWLNSIAATIGADPQQVRAHPLAQRFLQPQLTYEERTAGEDEQLFAFPGDAITLVEDSFEGDAALADGERYQQAAEAANIPEDIDSLFWMDVRDLLRPLVEPAQGQAWALLRNQLDHVGGPVGWTSSERDGKDTVRRSTVLVLLYD